MNVLGSEGLYKYLLPFFACLADAKVPYAVIKGEPLSMFAYGKLGQRHSGDIDLLVSRRNVATIKSALLSYGFDVENKNRLHQVIALSSTHQSIPYFKEINGTKIEIDINHDIFWGEYGGNRIDIDEFLSDVVQMMVYDCRVNTVPPLKAMIQLILHHYNEFNSLYHLSHKGECIKYNMFKDVYYLWKNNKEVISCSLHEICYKYEIIPYAYYVLYYTNKIFDDPVFGKLVKSFETAEGIALLDCYGLSEKERRVWSIDFYARLNKSNLFKFIERDMSTEDMEKIKRAQDIFA